MSIQTLEIIEWLRRAAAEIASEGHAGWGNTCTLAAERIEDLRKLIADAEWKGAYVSNGQEEYCCPWCGGDEPTEWRKARGKKCGHELDCPAFGDRR